MWCLSEAAIVVGEYAKDLEKQAASELQRYVYQMTGKLPAIQTEREGLTRAVMIGDWSSNPAMAEDRYMKLLKPYVSELKTQGFVICPVEDGLIVLGASPVSVLYAVYDLVESYGVGFHLGGDSVCARASCPAPRDVILKNPLFSIRGSLPWYNFFNSPTTWNPQDYQYFFDQMVKMKNNFVGFHAYDNEPFAAYEEDGVFKMGEPLLTTASSTWGTIPTHTKEFGFGTGVLYDREAFGADIAFGPGSRDDRIRGQQRMLAEALDYAKSRGLKVCLGFEVSGDLTQEEEQEQFEKRLTHLIETYPMLDYIWLWQPECWCGAEIQETHYHGHGFPLQPERSGFGSAVREYGSAFRYLSDPRQVNEGVRMTLYGRYAHELLRKKAPQMKLVLSGWGGDKWLHFSDLYPGLHRTLPADIVFSALDNINPNNEKNVSQYYGSVPGREVWPIPWFEYDGDQWCPQPFTKQFSYLLKDAADKGCSGVLGIHWRTRGVEEVASYTAQYSWSPGLTHESFYAKYALELYGEPLQQEMTGIHIQLHDLGYRWVGGPGQVECGVFRWVRSTARDKQETVSKLQEQVRSIMERAKREGLYTAYANLQYLADTMEWLLQYEKAADLFHEKGEPGEGLRRLIEAERLCGEGRLEEARGEWEEACRIMRDCGLQEAIQALSRTMSNRGELGILATVNAKAYADYRAKHERLKRVAEQLNEPMEAVSSGEPAAPAAEGGDAPGTERDEVVLLVPGRNTFALGVHRLEVLLHAGAGAALGHPKVCCYYRRAGEPEFTAMPLEPVTPAIHRGELEAPDQALIEYYLEAVDGDRIVGRWPAGAPARTQTLRGIGDAGGLKGEVTPHHSVKLTWKTRPGARSRCEITRRIQGSGESSRVIASVVGNQYEDYGIEEQAVYEYAISGEGGHCNCVVHTGEFAAPPAPMLRAGSGAGIGGRAHLAWDATGYGVREYRVYQSDSEEGPFTPAEEGVVAVTDSGYLSPGWAGAMGEALRLYFRIAAVGLDGKEGLPSNVVGVSGQRQPAEPLLCLELDGNTDNPQGHQAHWLMFPSYAHEADGGSARLEGRNMIYFSKEAELSPAHELTLSVRLKLQACNGVIAAKGMTGFRGYVLEYREGQLIFYLCGVGRVKAEADLQGGWRHVAAAYDGNRIRLYVDGLKIAEAPAKGRIPALSGQMRIGLGLQGLIKQLAIWPVGWTEEQVRAEYERQAGGSKSERVDVEEIVE